jgi:hypothetical protein
MLSHRGLLFSFVPLDLESNPERERERKSERRKTRSLERCCLLLQFLLQSCSRGGRVIVEDMCYEIRQAEACVD